ncbi:MAG: HAMP domain-containing sensor histidine kinase, partial [Dokdonella sp.]
MNKRPASLRWRVTLAFGLLGAVMSGLFAAATTFITEHYEEVLLDGMLSSVAADIGARHAQRTGKPVVLPQSHTLAGFLRHADGSGSVPEEYTSLPLGMHEVDLDDQRELRVGVFELDGDRLYLAVNLVDVESLETGLELILAAIVVIGTLIAAWLGWLFAGRTIAPVRRLAEAVEALPTRAQRTELGQREANDELGRLAVAIDSYQRRLVHADERERTFFADASHELRTPLAVVRGTAELLLDDGQLADQPRARIERLDRGVQTLADLLEVLLGLARGTTSPVELVDAAAWLDTTFADTPVIHRLEIRVASDAAGRLELRSREASLVVRGIVRRLERSR